VVDETLRTSDEGDWHAERLGKPADVDVIAGANAAEGRAARSPVAERQCAGPRAEYANAMRVIDIDDGVMFLS
jgi:hypothetical protein